MLRIFLLAVLCAFAAIPIATADEPAPTPATTQQQLEAKLKELAALQDEVDRLRRETKSTPQVLVKVKVLDVDHARLAKVGFGFRTAADPDHTDPIDFPAILEKLCTPAGKQSSPLDNKPTPTCVLPPNHAFMAFVDMLEKQKLAEIVCEPNLTAYSGLPASFQSGGAFPLAPGADTKDVTMKYYGTLVEFTSQVQGNNRVQVSFRAEISDIDMSRAITVGGQKVPGLRVCELATSFTAQPGETFVAANISQARTVEKRLGAKEKHLVTRLYLITPQLIDAQDVVALPKADAVRR